jgi:Na+/serine symporter
MEIIHQILIESVSDGFWKFIGYWIIIAMFLTTIFNIIAFIINRPLRHWTIRKHGYPPIHCDADGDLKKEE